MAGASDRSRRERDVSEQGSSGVEQTEEQVHGESASGRLFDLRWLIAIMFAVYGIVLIVTGLFDSKAEIAKAAGVRINLWTGVGMLVTGLVFVVWARLRPLRRDQQ